MLTEKLLWMGLKSSACNSIVAYTEKNQVHWVCLKCSALRLGPQQQLVCQSEVVCALVLVWNRFDAAAEFFLLMPMRNHIHWIWVHLVSHSTNTAGTIHQKSKLQKSFELVVLLDIQP